MTDSESGDAPVSTGIDLDAIETDWNEAMSAEVVAAHTPALIAELRAARAREQHLRDFCDERDRSLIDHHDTWEIRAILDEEPADGR